MANAYNITIPTQISTVSGAITSILASGFSQSDTAVLNIISGNYTGTSIFDLNSGYLTIQSASLSNIDSYTFVNNGELVLKNISYNNMIVNGSGFISLYSVSGYNTNVSGCQSLYTNTNVVGNTLSVINSNSTYLNYLYASGNDTLSFLNNISVSMVSGSFYNYNGVGYQTTFTLCSGIFINNNMAANVSGNMLLFQGCPNVSFYYDTFASNVSGYAIAKFATYSSIPCSGIINYSIMVGNAGSGQGPLIINNGQLISSNTSCLYNFTTQTYTGISGSYFNADPLFINASGGDLRPSVVSPCACAGGPIAFLEEFDNTNITVNTPTQKSISFTLPNSTIWAIPPSNVFTVGNGLAMLYQADPNIDNDMDVTVNTQYIVNGSGMTEQSYRNNNTSNYIYDYRLIPYNDPVNNTVLYYVEPFTIFDYSDVINSLVSTTFQDISVSGIYKYHGFSRDTFQTLGGTGIYWVGEVYNRYLYGFSIFGNTKILTYPLFPMSGGLSIQLQDLQIISQTAGQTSVRSNNVWVNDHYESRNIDIAQATTTLPFQSYEFDPSLSISALAVMSDYVYVLAKNINPVNTLIGWEHDLYLYNKYDTELFLSPTNIFSGIAGLNTINVGDMTFNDLGNLVVGYSGYVNYYQFFYDYALATRSTGTIKTTLLLREKYNGVNL